MFKISDRLFNYAVALILLLATIILLQPGSPIWTQIRSWNAARQLHHRIESRWDQLASDGGRLDAGTVPITLVEFSDYECPYCRASHHAVENLAATNTVGIIFHHLPLPIHRHAEAAARAAICSEAQGKFREMNRRLFETTTWQQDENWTREAQAAGVPLINQFVTCLSGPDTDKRLAADRELAKYLGVNGTPAFVTPKALSLGIMSDERLHEFLTQDR